MGIVNALPDLNKVDVELNSLISRVETLEESIASTVIYGTTRNGTTFNVTASNISATSGQILRIATSYEEVTDYLPVFSSTSATLPYGGTATLTSGGDVSEDYPIKNAFDSSDTTYLTSVVGQSTGSYEATRSGWVQVNLPATIKISEVNVIAKGPTNPSTYVQVVTYGENGAQTASSSAYVGYTTGVTTTISLGGFHEAKQIRLILKGSSSATQAGTGYLYDACFSKVVPCYYRPTLNLNGVTATINGNILCGESYTLLYNGTSWDITTI